jgi:hypothetical protein
MMDEKQYWINKDGYEFQEHQQRMAFITEHGCYLNRPCMMWQPKIYLDGNKWCALLGANLQDGVAGFGDSPEEAMKAFDDAWKGGKP